MLRLPWRRKAQSPEPQDQEPFELDETAKVAVQRLIEFLLRPALQIAIEQGTATSRWLLASLLAVNGGALIGVLNADTPLENLHIIAPAWLVGVLFALATGLASYWANHKAIEDVTGVIGVLEKAMVVGTLDFVDWKATQKKIKRRGWWTFAFGVLSALAFMVGAASAAVSLRSTLNSDDPLLDAKRPSQGARPEPRQP